MIFVMQNISMFILHRHMYHTDHEEDVDEDEKTT